MSFLVSSSPGNVKQRLPTGFKFDNDLKWNRPTGWLDLGINAEYGATGVPEKIIGLVALFPNDVSPAHNYVAFHCDTNDDSHILVDWGDGNPAETGHQSDFSSDVDGYAVSSHGSVSQSGTYNGKTGVLVHATTNEGRVGIKNTSVDLLSGNNYTLTFDYYADAAFNGDVWGVEGAFANRASIASNAPSIETGVWTGASLTIPSNRPLSSSQDELHIRPQDDANSVYGVLANDAQIGFQNIKVVVNNSGSGYYIKENVDNHHVYDYDIITGDTSTTKSTLFREYKQVIFEVSLIGSAKFSQISFDVNGPFNTFTSINYRKGPPILDIFVSSSNSTDIRVGASRPLFMCEQIEIRNTSSNRQDYPGLLYRGCKRLQSIPFVPWINNSSTESYIYGFMECMALKFLPDDFADNDKFWFKNPSSLQQCFDTCESLVYLPEGLFGAPGSVLSNCSNYYAMFSNCRKLKQIPYIGVRTGSGVDTRLDYSFNTCNALIAIPKGWSLQRSNNSGIDRHFNGCLSIKDYSALFDGISDWLSTLNNTGPPSFNLDMTAFFAANRQLSEFPYIGQFTKVTQVKEMSNQNYNIERFSPLYTHLDFKNCTTIQSLFQSNRALKEVPEIRLRSLTTNNALQRPFYDCRSLQFIKITGLISYTANGEYYQCFYRCPTLTCIDGMDFSFATETSDYFQMFHVCRNINAIKFPGTFRAGYASSRINVTVANHADISGEYHITEDGTGYAQASGNGVLTVAESSGNYTWTIKDSSDDTPTESSSASSSTQFTPWAADWSGATNAVTFSEVMTGFKYTVSGNSGDGLRYSPIQRTQMLEIFNQLLTVSYTATLDIRNNPYTADLTDDDKAIATDKGWTLSL